MIRQGISDICADGVSGKGQAWHKTCVGYAKVLSLVSCVTRMAFEAGQLARDCDIDVLCFEAVAGFSGIEIEI